MSHSAATGIGANTQKRVMELFAEYNQHKEACKKQQELVNEMDPDDPDYMDQYMIVHMIQIRMADIQNVMGVLMSRKF